VFFYYSWLWNLNNLSYNLAHAVVKWVKENNQFSIVKLTTISENKPVLDMIYKVYFDNEFHDGQVKFIGDQNTCKIKQNQILGLIASPKLYKSFIFISYLVKIND